MANRLLITEIFYSLQGETSLIGMPFLFIRLTGCNLRCTYCDSAYSFSGGKKMSVDEILTQVKKHKVKHVLVTGGEPLLQRNSITLIDRLNQENYQVSVETHGEVSIQDASTRARIIMDIKTPGSGMSQGGYLNNLQFLKPTDEVKFVITSMNDYAWASDIVLRGLIPTNEILFSPAMPAQNAPGAYEGISPRTLADLIVRDQLPVRFQWQLHKLLWGADTQGV